MKKYLLLLLAFCGISSVFFAQPKQYVTWTFTQKKIAANQFELTFTANIEPTYHLYSQIETPNGPLPTVFEFEKSSDYKLIGKPSEPKPKEQKEPIYDNLVVRFFENKAIFKQKIQALTNKPFVVKGLIDGMSCNELRCQKFSPKPEFSFSIEGAEIVANNAIHEAPADIKSEENKTTITTTLATNDSNKLSSSTPTTPIVPEGKTPTTENINASEIKPARETKNEDCNAWQKFFLGLAAGLGAMLMPCIYSMIPLTVSFFLKRTKSRAAAIRDSLFYGVSIIISFVVPTMLVTIIFGPTALSNIATNTYLNLFFFLLFLVFALSFFGLFEITLPSSWANKLDAKADKGGFLGIFFMALTLVVVSFSCTAGFLGPLLSTLASGESYLCPFAGFTGFGLGIALPFMLFAFFPSMLKSLPKSGGWMTTFKVTIAFIELALAVKFLANADNVNEWGWITREVFISLWVAISGALTLYLFGAFRTSHDDPPSHLSVGRILWATFFAAFTIYMIPGLWGAPLKIISSFPPPHNYAESPHGVGYHGSGSVATASQNSNNSETSSLENTMVVGPSPEINLFKDDYEGALKYAKLVNKPLFVDFTGKACQNCRLMETTVWISNEVLPMLRDSVVIVSLYVDSKVELPKQEQKEVFWYGKNRTLSTIGDKWAYLQTTRYNASSQPQYVLLNHDESNASNGTMETEKDAKKFAEWLRQGIKKFYSK